MVTKTIENLDELTWRRFVALCNITGVLVGDELNKIFTLDVEGKGELVMSVVVELGI